MRNNKIKKIFLFVLVLFSSVVLLAPKSSADEQNYETKGNVGFTGTWPSSTTESKPPQSTQKIPETQKEFPKTGDTTSSSVVMSVAGTMILFFITSYKMNNRRMKV